MWSLTKARKVLEIINPQAKPFGLVFRPIEITTHEMPHPRVLLASFCIEHQCAVPLDDVCPKCLRYCRD